MSRQIVKLRMIGAFLSISSLAMVLLSNRSWMFREKERWSDFKYILTWTPDTQNVKLMGWSYPQLDGFEQAGCPEYRCYLTNNRSYLGMVGLSYSL